MLSEADCVHGMYVAIRAKGVFCYTVHIVYLAIICHANMYDLDIMFCNFEGND